jgi:histidinol phosphatase-like PHP family hydrolase
MFKFNKKLFYKYFDLYRVSWFLNDVNQKKRADFNMALIHNNSDTDFQNISSFILEKLGFDRMSISEIQQFQQSRTIQYINDYKKQIEPWILDLILQDFFDLDLLNATFKTESIKNKSELIAFFNSEKANTIYGTELSNLYAHYITKADGSDFPLEFVSSNNHSIPLLSTINGQPILGNFHNHSIYSDGECNIKELQKMAEVANREYIGISDHSQIMNGLNDRKIIEQHKEISALNKQGCKILRSIECEILSDGTLDLSDELLNRMSYVIIAVHHNMNMKKYEANNRLIKAIENRFSSIIAHPSARLYRRKVELFVDMEKIIDACVANKVVIEINGDPERLDLDPKYIEYAVNRGAMFSLDSDTHSMSGFNYINNAIRIAEYCHIPAERCINTFKIRELESVLKGNIE